MNAPENLAADVVVLGTGSGGGNVARDLAQAGRTVIAIEDNLVGGECKYLACIPSKAMLRSAGVRALAPRWVDLGAGPFAPQLGPDDVAYRVAVRRRDQLAQQRDDTAAEKELTAAGVQLIRGHGRILDEGTVQVGGQVVRYRELVIATGSRPVIPDLPGLHQVPSWTSDQALSAQDRPASAIVLGGGAVGCEIAQFLARFGTAVTLLDPGKQLLGKEEPGVARELRDRLAAQFDIRLEVSAERVEPHAAGLRLFLSDGSTLEAARLITATGREPRLEGLGLDALGLAGIEVDDRCAVRGAKHVWAVGDVTQVAPYTHTASYQARILVNNLMGNHATVVSDAIPRAVYTDPPVASVGLDESAAQDKGFDALSLCVRLDDLPRNNTDGDHGGVLVLTADRHRRILLGAAAVGARADEWIGEAVLAIRAQIPIATLREVIHPFPTISTVYENAYAELLDALG
ncbi:MAG: dihydrolipoyl dehydrogenase family protein [Sporichthyaceae bacterium]